MATSRSSKKRVRQNETHRIRNRAEKSRVKTVIKSFQEAIDAKNVDTARKGLAEVTSLLDRAARRNVIHRNKAARAKANLQRALNRLAGAPAAQK
jgi:small subunit ribosomal protein S20